MILRHFEIKDIKALQKYRYPDKNDLEVLKMINEWNMGGCSGRYFEMFSAVHAGQVVGEISLHENTKDSVSVGIHIFEPFRKKGYGTFCLKFAIKKAIAAADGEFDTKWNDMLDVVKNIVDIEAMEQKMNEIAKAYIAE